MGLRSSISRRTGSTRNATVADQAAEWLATLSDESCTAEERQEFANWLRRSNLHVEEFLRLSTLARQLNTPALWSSDSVEQLIAEALKYQSTVATLATSRTPVRRRASPGFRRLFWILPLSAAGVLAIVMALFFNPEMLDRSGTTYATAVGEQRSVTLEDGSVVELNTQSSLRTRFTPSERVVELLQGEAIFRVAKNPQRPFRVLSGASEIVAIGTAFNVYARPSGTVVTVIEGRVRVGHKSDSPPAANGTTAAGGSVHDLELTRGEQALIAPQQPIVRIALADPSKATAWTERRLIFEETPLAAVTAEFARYYDAKTIRIADPALAQLHITGVFDASDPASLVQFLQTYGDIEIREDAQGWVLLGTHP